MSEKNLLDQQYIMNLKPGPELDTAVSIALDEYITIDTGCEPHTPPWSTDKHKALELMDIIDESIEQVGIVRMGPDAPQLISQMAGVGYEDDAVHVFTDNWMESLSKAFLLYANGNRGDFNHPEWDRLMKEAPKRPLVN